jgi:hypothetical protein
MFQELIRTDKQATRRRRTYKEIRAPKDQTNRNSKPEGESSSSVLTQHEDQHKPAYIYI